MQQISLRMPRWHGRVSLMPDETRPVRYLPCDRLCALICLFGEIGLCAESIALGARAPEVRATIVPCSKLSQEAERWYLNGEITYRGSRAEGLLLNARIVNSVLEDQCKPGFDPEANTNRFLAHLPEYAAHGIRAFGLVVMPGCFYQRQDLLVGGGSESLGSFRSAF